MIFVIRGMRNPLNSWNKGDSMAVIDGDYITVSGDIGPAPADDPDGFMSRGMLSAAQTAN